MIVFLDWSDLDSTVASVLLKWIYTGKVSQEYLTLSLMKAAASFQLSELVDQCEKYLIGMVGLKDCVVLYAAAEELGTVKLKEHCSSLISAHWVKTAIIVLCTFYRDDAVVLDTPPVHPTGRSNGRRFQGDARFSALQTAAK